MTKSIIRREAARSRRRAERAAAWRKIAPLQLYGERADGIGLSATGAALFFLLAGMAAAVALLAAEVML